MQLLLEPHSLPSFETSEIDINPEIDPAMTPAAPTPAPIHVTSVGLCDFGGPFSPGCSGWAGWSPPSFAFGSEPPLVSATCTSFCSPSLTSTVCSPREPAPLATTVCRPRLTLPGGPTAAAGGGMPS